MNALTLPLSWALHSHGATALTHTHTHTTGRNTVRTPTHPHAHPHTRTKILYMCLHTHTESYSRKGAPPLPRKTPPHNKQLPASTSAALGAAFVSPRRFIIRGWHSCCAAVVVVSTTGPRRNRQLGADTESSAEFDLICKCKPGPEWVNTVKPTGLIEEQGREKADTRARGNGRQRDNNNTDSGNVIFKSEKKNKLFRHLFLIVFIAGGSLEIC